MSDQRNDADTRPSPDALLETVRREERRAGRLKIFIGAAPGVGKTYEMLQTARMKQKDGVDVVVGVVETHGRSETAALLDGLEIIPRRVVSYRNKLIEEMDIDALIARHPQLALVDELAHTNAPGSRHPKRYLDVEELLNRGIDVYTTINIQHVESLNDVVAQITRIRVRETVPDSILDRADDIELVDLTPEDLIERLKDGKVYVSKQAERALRHYFSPGNLTALRELALRRTAEQVDDQLLSHMQANAIQGPWAAGDHILVCVNEDPRSAMLVRYAKRMSDRLHAGFTALTFETDRTLQLAEEDRDRISQALRLAEHLGGEAITIPAQARNIAEDIIAFARSKNVTHIVIGKTTRSRWFEILNGSIVHDLVRRSGSTSVHVIGDIGPVEHLPKPAMGSAQPEPRSFNPTPFVAAALSVAAALGVSLLVRTWVGTESVDLVFLTAIIGIAVRFGLVASLSASVLATLCYNYFFLPPLYTLTISDPTNIASFVLFVVVAIIVSKLAAQVRSQALIAVARARTTEQLYAFSRKLAGTGTLDDVLWVSVHQIASMLKVRVVVLLPNENTLELRAGYPPEDTLDQADIAAATWTWEHNRAAGRGADTLPGAKRLFLPLRTGRGIVGVLGIDDDKTGPMLTPDQRRLLTALSDQGALAIERVNLVEDVEKSRISLERDRLRAALLTSLSHDLRTPLAGILGSAGALRELSAKLTDAEKADLVMTIIEESERLNRFIANLLDMTRLESGAVKPNSSLYDIRESIGAALKSANKILGEHTVQLELAENLPLVEIDPVLFEQVLFNLFDNAAKYSNPGSTIHVRAWGAEHNVYLQMLDEGPGIPPDDLELVFERFYRVQKGDRVRAGTGLGLAISRGFIEAMHGTIEAGNRTDKQGAVFTIMLPVAAALEVVDTA